MYDVSQAISDLIDADDDARYYALDFWTKAPWGRDQVQLPRQIGKTCQFASCRLFGDLNRNSLNRIPLHLSLGVMMLPAQKRDGVFHVHGFLRVPQAALTLGRDRLSQDTDGRRCVVDAPLAVVLFASYLREFSAGAPSSLHIDHQEATFPHATDMTTDKKRRVEKLGYLTQAGAEVRSWDLMMFVPKNAWKPLFTGWSTSGVEMADRRAVSLLRHGATTEVVRPTTSRADSLPTAATRPVRRLPSPGVRRARRQGPRPIEEAGGEAREEQRPSATCVADCASETERRVSGPRACVHCGKSLDGRAPRARSCSDKCRMQAGRRARVAEWRSIRARLDQLLGATGPDEGA